jgi:hypothetical protein
MDKHCYAVGEKQTHPAAKNNLTGLEISPLSSVTINLAPPFKMGSEAQSFTVKLAAVTVGLRQLAAQIKNDRSLNIQPAVMDDSGTLMASFMINGKHAKPNESVRHGDNVIIYKRIGGG